MIILIYYVHQFKNKSILLINNSIHGVFLIKMNMQHKDLSKQSSDFLWLQLFHDVILHLPRDEQAKKQMIDACRHYYQNNLKELKLIDEFEQKYQSKEAIHWYMKNSFLRKMINKALRTEDINQLYILRYFLS